jgi:uncharacterized membrane protein
MSIFIKLYLISLPVFFGIDLIWLSLVARKLYLQQLGALMKTNINWVVAITFYLLFITGLVFFAILPAIEKHNWLQAVVYGALFGFFAYATYDLTNLATLKNWPLLISIVDMLWGTVLAALVSAIVYVIFIKIT